MNNETSKSKLEISKPHLDTKNIHEHSSSTSTLPETNVTGEIVSGPQKTNTNVKIINLITFGWVGRTLPQNSTLSTVYRQSTRPTSTAECELSVQPIDHLTFPKKTGRFLIGFHGNLDAEDIDDNIDIGSGSITTRSVWVQQKPCPAPNGTAGDHGLDSTNKIHFNEFKLVVYTVSLHLEFSIAFNLTRYIELLNLLYHGLSSR